MQLSVWEKESFFAPADVLIAGSGFVGLWSAYYLKKNNPSLKITVVDRGVIPTGASTRNAGFACFGSPTELMGDVNSMGENNMLELVEMRHTGISRIQKLFGKREIDFDGCGGYEMINAVSPERYDQLHDQLHWLNKHLSSITHKKETFAFADNKIKKFGFNNVAHLIKTTQEGSLHPGKLCQKLLQRVQKMGVNVLSGVEIKHYEPGENGITLSTDKHFRLSAGKIIICTNAFAKQLLPGLDINPARGQVLVTAPIPSLKIKGTFHFDEGYYYFRNLGNRLLLGGARNSAPGQEGTLHLDITDNIQQKLEAFISDHLLPGTPFQVTDRWSGIMGMGVEKMPIVRKISDNVFCAVRMSGMGVALAPVVGKKIAEMVD
ncbi:MAG: FAD-binding oxidoreductase [Chitinophagaceae bacterium]|nr:FAD-binding oxidoreductase [Chitinophagaceae bacterium]